jgi:hypothetical protein
LKKSVKAIDTKQISNLLNIVSEKYIKDETMRNNAIELLKTTFGKFK